MMNLDFFRVLGLCLVFHKVQKITIQITVQGLSQSFRIQNETQQRAALQP
jgi:hypothetical protein